MNQSDVIKHIGLNTSRPIPPRKVLETALEKPQRNTKEFLQQVNNHGLPEDSLIIRLKGKERDIKNVGRFFSMMSWDSREYFVTTECLIKTYYVPLFHGLTMADDLTSVNKKIIQLSRSWS